MKTFVSKEKSILTEGQGHRGFSIPFSSYGHTRTGPQVDMDSNPRPNRQEQSDKLVDHLVPVISYPRVKVKVSTTER